MPCLNYVLDQDDYNNNISNIKECLWFKHINLNSRVLLSDVKSCQEGLKYIKRQENDYPDLINQSQNQKLAEQVCKMCNFRFESIEALKVHSLDCCKSFISVNSGGKNDITNKFIIRTRSTKKMAKKKRKRDFLLKTSSRDDLNQRNYDNEFLSNDINSNLPAICNNLPHETYSDQNSEQNFFEYLNLCQKENINSEISNESLSLVNSKNIEENTLKLPVLKILKQDISSKIGSHLYKDFFNHYKCNEYSDVLLIDSSYDDSISVDYPISFRSQGKHHQHNSHNYKFPYEYKRKCMKMKRRYQKVLRPCKVSLKQLNAQDIENLCQSLRLENGISYSGSKTLKTYSRPKSEKKWTDSSPIIMTDINPSVDNLSNEVYSNCKSLIEDIHGNSYINISKVRFKCHLCSVMIVCYLDTLIDISNHFSQCHNIQGFSIDKLKQDNGMFKLSLVYHDS